ncbi:MAG: hypothetical protein IKJ06_03725 [Clostridia bacterium]|nr:hypothetical protein [Clostridia bacterium]
MYSFYNAIFGGDKIKDEGTFERIIFYAKAFLRKISNPSFDIDYESEDVKIGLCALCDCIYDKLESSNILREEWDGFVRTYSSQSGYEELLKVASLFFPAELLYRGCDV